MDKNDRKKVAEYAELIIDLESKLKAQQELINAVKEDLLNLKNDYSFGNAQVYIDIDKAIAKLEEK